MNSSLLVNITKTLSYWKEGYQPLLGCVDVPIHDKYWMNAVEIIEVQPCATSKHTITMPSGMYYYSRFKLGPLRLGYASFDAMI